MFDIGVTKLMIVGGIALIVIGPERLPRVARMVGTLVGRAQRYVADVKAEVNRSIELEELQKMKTQFESAAREVNESVNRGLDETRSGLEQAVSTEGLPTLESSPRHIARMTPPPPPPAYKPPKKNWRLKRSAMPDWYKRREGVRMHAQSGAARVARFRPSGRGRLL
jgi:sec-independent protein translocase protein TatB